MRHCLTAELIWLIQLESHWTEHETLALDGP